MHVNQKQSSSSTAERDRVIQLLQSGILKQQSYNKISHSDIVSSSKDDTVKLRRLKRKSGKKGRPCRNLGSLGKKAAKDLIKDLVEELVDHFSGSNEEQFTGKEQQVTEGQLKDSVEEMLDRGFLEEVWDRGFVKEILEKVSAAPNSFMVLNKLSEALDELFGTSKQQISEGQQVTVECINTSLHLAAEEDNLEAVRYFVEKGGDISAQDEMGYTPLHLAAKQGNLGIVKYLIEKGANVDVYFYQGGYRTPLHLAAANGHLDTVKYLMAKGANPKATDSDGKTPVQRANENGHLGIVEYFASRGLSVTEVPQTTEGQRVTENYSNTSSHLAAEQDNIWAYLVVAGGNLDKGSNTFVGGRLEKGGDTPLHLAAFHGEVENVKALIERGNNVNARNKYNLTPLPVAAIRDNLETAQFLLNRDADVNAQTVNGLTPLNIATLSNHLAMVKLLLDYCADVNIKEGESDARYNFGYGRTPLISAVVDCNIEIAKLLLDNGADVSIKCRGLTALGFASVNKDKCPEMLTLLKDGNIKGSDSRNHCTSTMAASGATRTSPFINGLLNWVRNITPQNIIALFNSQQSKSSHNGYNVSSSSWMNNDVVSGVKGLVSSTEPAALFTSKEHSNTAATALPEINTTVVNNTIMLGILAAGLFNKTQHRQSVHENLLSPKEQLMKGIGNSSRLLEEALQKGKKEGWGNPSTDMGEVEISGNKTGSGKESK